jgi:hydroxymethylbilane synthase
MTALRVGTRGSALALVQSNTVAAILREANPGLDVDVVEIATRGDTDRETPLSEGTSVGWFTTAIQEALLRDEIDVAVHSYKDLPTKRPEGLVIAAVPRRADPRDALVSRSGQRLRDLPQGARVGTSSPRRSAQVLGIRPDLQVDPIRGNVETRIAKVADGEYDATILAYAGLQRLGRTGEAVQVFGYEEMLPAPAQGALAVECRAKDNRALTLARSIDDADLRNIVTAERVFLATLEAGCSFPAAAYAEHFGSTLKLHGLVAPDGRVVRSKIGGPRETAAGLGKELAEELMRAAGMR